MRHTAPIILLALTACDPGGPGGNPEVDLVTFASCDDMKDHLTESFIHQYGGYGSFGAVDEAALPEDSGSSDSGGSGPSDYSTTNIQEQGVEEPDMVKTDGEFIYLTMGDELRIVSSWPVEDAEEVGSVELSGNSSKMFLKDDRIIAYATEYVDDGDRWSTRTIVDVVDVSDRARPVVISSKSIDGHFVSARRIGSDVYTVTQQSISLPYGVYEDIWEATSDIDYLRWDATPLAKETHRRTLHNAIRPVVRDAIENTPISEFLPSITHEDGSRDSLAGCTDILHSADVSRPGMTLVSHINMEDDAVRMSGDATAVMAGSTTVYSSKQALYVAQSSFGWWDGFSRIDQVTRMHQFTLDGPETRYTASGEVDGFLHNQFSMSEHEGLLRVATTSQNWWWGTDEENEQEGNNIFVLDAENPQMPIIGELRGLAPGERIYSTRFQADRAFMVTFVQIDPLFTIDLSRPTDPKAVGELKIPGYSAYLQAIGDDHVLGVGMDGDWDGGISGVAISLFDVSDFSDPQQQDQLTLECDYSWSEALWNHHAIMVHNDTVAIPAYGYNWTGSEYGYENSSGLLVATIDTETGLNRTGFVDHNKLADEVWGTSDRTYSPQMLRSLTIEDTLFSISTVGVIASDLNAPELPIAAVPLY